MKREDLIEGAKLLVAPSTASTESFEKKQDTIGAELNRRMLARPDIERLIGKDNQEMMKNNTHNFLRFMTALFHRYDPAVLADTCLWAFKTYRAHGFQVSYWPANIDTLMQVMRTELPGKVYGEVFPFFNWVIVNIPAFSIITDTMPEITEPGPAHGQ
jgi:hypothetical protein